MESGFSIHPEVFSKSECLALATALSDSAPLRAGSRHLMKNETVAAVARDPRLLTLAGDARIPYRATLFSKTPQSNWLISWHQDTALPVARRFDAAGWGPWSLKAGISYAHAPAWALSQIVALRLNLDDSTSGNGPLRVIPGSHSSGVLSDEAVQRCAHSSEPVECLTMAGGVVRMRPLLIHASSKVREGSSARRVLHIEYAPALQLAPGIRLAVA